MPRAERPRGAASRLRLAVAAAAIAAAAGLGACSFDYGQGTNASKAQALPSAVFTNYEHSVVTRGALSFRLTASRAETYDADKKTLLQDVRFAEYDPDTGKLVSSGRSDRAVYYSEHGDAEFSGDVRLESKRQDAVLVGEYLRWDGKAKKLSGELERSVTISRSDGSSVSGGGFEAEALSRSFSFRGGAEGRIVVKDKSRDSSAGGDE